MKAFIEGIGNIEASEDVISRLRRSVKNNSNSNGDGEVKTGCERTGDCPIECDDCLDDYTSKEINMKRRGDSYEYDDQGGRWTRARFDSIYGKGAFEKDLRELFGRTTSRQQKHSRFDDAYYERAFTDAEQRAYAKAYDRDHGPCAYELDGDFLDYNGKSGDNARLALLVSGSNGHSNNGNGNGHRGSNLRVNDGDRYRYAFVDIDAPRKSAIMKLVQMAMLVLGSHTLPEVRFFKKCEQGDMPDFSRPTPINGLCDSATGAVELRHDMGAAELLTFLGHECFHSAKHKGVAPGIRCEQEAHAFGPAFAKRFLPHDAFIGDVLVYNGDEDPVNYKHSVHLDASNGTVLLDLRRRASFQKSRLDWIKLKVWD